MGPRKASWQCGFPWPRLSFDHHRRASGCVEFSCCGSGIQTLGHFVVIRHEAEDEVDDTAPDLPLKGEHRCGVQPSTAGPAHWASRQLDSPPASRVVTTELRRLRTAEGADIAQRHAGVPATMRRKQSAARTMRRELVKECPHPARWRKSMHHEERILDRPPMTMEYLARMLGRLSISRHGALVTGEDLSPSSLIPHQHRKRVIADFMNSMRKFPALHSVEPPHAPFRPPTSHKFSVPCRELPRGDGS
jgi:hypothetical protein